MRRGRVKGTVYSRVEGFKRGVSFVFEVLSCGHEVATETSLWIRATKRRCTICEAKLRKERG